MIGAIIGDVVGSTYEVKEVLAHKQGTKISFEERTKILDSDVPLFTVDSSITDDSILTVAIADAYLNNLSYEDKLKEYGIREFDRGKQKYGRTRFGQSFELWLRDGMFKNSYGNGCAMRISSIPVLMDNLNDMKKEVYKATIPTYNHNDAINCTEALASAIYLAKRGMKKNEIKKYIEDNYFKLNFNLSYLQHNYEFSSKAVESVPHAIFIFLESNNFSDAIRKSISIGGDSDTISCMVGSIAGNYYDIPEDLVTGVLEYIPDYMMDVINQFYERINENDGKVSSVSKIIRKSR